MFTSTGLLERVFSMTTINYVLQKNWPKLAWVCVVNRSAQCADLFHGPLVEIAENWAVEAVWDGGFECGDFDKADLIFGSGVRRRGEQLIFVSSATGIDRLWYCEIDGHIYISNSLPGLLKVADLSLDENYPNYVSDLFTVESRGLNSYKESIPSSGTDINIVYFKNIVWNEGQLVLVDKPDLFPSVKSYKDYETYLLEAAERMGANARSAKRSHGIEMIAGLSSGYDSVAATVVAQAAGCTKTFSIVNSSSLWRGSDSGEKIATYLNVQCQTYRQEPKAYRNEVTVWAGSGGSGGRNLSIFEYPQPLSLFFSGGYGDTVWERKQQGLAEAVGDFEEMMCEFRLVTGLFMTLVPWWGIRHAAEIQKISLLEEMKPWTLNTDYDRPIARRLGERAGVPRELFGVRKKDTASNTPFWWPSTSEAHESFNLFLKNLGMKPYSKFKVFLLKEFNKFLKLFNSNVLFFMSNNKKWRPWLTSPVRPLLFIWANTHLKDRYYND
ncbi:hypothetical protein SAMN02745165_02678 [Malonomonas rubra DSM 5091]|uniref:Asparagine synthase n=1 Tax=Malonomonas rubra DSM 5091 TaxID=1122189 RepID=A0A1M6KDP4_MALRU|nr:hypothetical protein [Malonomonas rubra]SHJ57042.1 hypothetical protein SAMN02745165_02678 [Malonomonas rubra DSM 5091]